MNVIGGRGSVGMALFGLLYNLIMFGLKILFYTYMALIVAVVIIVSCASKGISALYRRRQEKKQLRQPASSAAPEEDPVLRWLASPEARQHENHWVALDPQTGKFLGMADALPSLRMWQARGAMVLYVDPLPENWSDE